MEHHGCCDHCGVPGGDGYRHLGSGAEMAGAGGVGGISLESKVKVIYLYQKFSRNYHQIYHDIIDINCK